MEKTPFEEFSELSSKDKFSILKSQDFLAKFAPTLTALEAHEIKKLMIKTGLSTDFFETKRNKYIDKIFEDKDKLKQTSYEEIAELISERFFGDVLFNLELDVETILNFAKDSPRNALLVPHLEFCEDLYKNFIQQSSFNSLVNNYNYFKQITKESNNEKVFRNFIEESKECSVYEMANNLVKTLHLPSNKDKSFAMFTHTMTIPRGDKRDDAEILEDWINPNPNKVRREKISLCYISDKNPTFFPSAHNTVTFGFLNINPENVEHISATNSFSNSNIKRTQSLFSVDTFTKLTNEIPSNKSYSKNYNEFVYKKPKGFQKGKVALMPSVIISQSEEPTELETKYAKAFGCKIIRINPLEYKVNKSATKSKSEFLDWRSQVYR